MHCCRHAGKGVRYLASQLSVDAWPTASNATANLHGNQKSRTVIFLQEQLKKPPVIPAMQQMPGLLPSSSWLSTLLTPNLRCCKEPASCLHRAARVPEMPSLACPSSTSFLSASPCGLKWSCFPVSLGSLWLDSGLHEDKSVCNNPGIISNTHLTASRAWPTVGSLWLLAGWIHGIK